MIIDVNFELVISLEMLIFYIPYSLYTGIHPILAYVWLINNFWSEALYNVDVYVGIFKYSIASIYFWQLFLTIDRWYRSKLNLPQHVIIIYQPEGAIVKLKCKNSTYTIMMSKKK